MTFAIVSLCALAAVFTLVIGAAGGIVALRARKMHSQTSELGTQLGFHQIAPAARKQAMWFGGDWQGRLAGLSHPFLPTRGFDVIRDRSATDWEPGTRVAVGVGKRLGNIKVYRTYNLGLAGPDEPFEEAFPVREGDAALSDADRDALLAFVRQHGGLRLQDRASLHPLPYPVGVLDEVPVVLVHDSLGTLDLNALRVRLDALASLAEVLERP